MNRIQMIQAIGDLLTRLDVLRGSLLPSHPERQALNDLRLLLDDRQRKLSQQHFDENTEAFRVAAADFRKVNADVKETIDRVDRLVDTITGVRRLLSTVDTVMGASLPLV